jgi:hypothetical protein
LVAPPHTKPNDWIAKAVPLLGVSGGQSPLILLNGH